jgi:hypothetical protein
VSDRQKNAPQGGKRDWGRAFYYSFGLRQSSDEAQGTTEGEQVNWLRNKELSMTTKFEPIELGDRVKDSVTGFTGIAIAITTWLHGCIRIGVQPEKKDKDGKPLESVHFDQSQLVMVKKAIHTPQVLEVQAKPKPEIRRSSGGPSREASGFQRR